MPSAVGEHHILTVWDKTVLLVHAMSCLERKGLTSYSLTIHERIDAVFGVVESEHEGFGDDGDECLL